MTLDDVIARESIRETIAAYTIAGDSRDAEAFVALFAEDAVLEFAGFPPVPGFHNEGIQNIRHRTSSWSSIAGKDPALRDTGFIRHNLATCQIDLTGPDTARARTYFMVFTDIGPDHSGTYSDELIRQGDRWLFAQRRVALDWRSPQSLFPPLK
jgi:ketosteroid isomerase-like protein